MWKPLTGFCRGTRQVSLRLRIQVAAFYFSGSTRPHSRLSYTAVSAQFFWHLKELSADLAQRGCEVQLLHSSWHRLTWLWFIQELCYACKGLDKTGKYREELKSAKWEVFCWRIRAADWELSRCRLWSNKPWERSIRPRLSLIDPLSQSKALRQQEDSQHKAAKQKTSTGSVQVPSQIIYVSPAH